METIRRMDSFPTYKKEGIEYRVGRVFPFGASIVPGGVNFSIFSKEATECQLLLYHVGNKEPFIRIPLTREFRVGDVYSVMVVGLDIEDLEYGYCFDGPYLPQKGLRFDKNKVLLDPYAKSITGRTIWGKQDEGHEQFIHRGCVIYLKRGRMKPAIRKYHFIVKNHGT